MFKSIYFALSLTIIICANLLIVANSFRIEHSNELGDPNKPVDVKLVLDISRLLEDGLNSEQGPGKTPVVFWHGMGDTAFGSVNILKLALEREYPGISVYSIQIGNNSWQDELGGYFVNVNYQIEQACKAILAEPSIREYGSFNAIGFSQGAQFLRGLIQRCPLRDNGIQVKNFISLGGQHQGVFGLPNCPEKTFCDYIRYLLTTAAYETQVQEHIVQAEYWHDPLKEEIYKAKNIFIADINNERVINETYKQNLLALDHMILVEFLQDDMVVPPESSAFGFFKPGQASQIEPLQSTRLYQEDRLGLKEMDSRGSLVIIKVPGKHLQFHVSWFMDEIAKRYLEN